MGAAFAALAFAALRNTSALVGDRAVEPAFTLKVCA